MKSFHGNTYQKKKIGIWHSLNSKNLKKLRKLKTNYLEKNNFLKNLYKIGYSKSKKILKSNYLKIITISFQRRFRQELINGIIDQECLLISDNLAKKINKLS